MKSLTKDLRKKGLQMVSEPVIDPTFGKVYTFQSLKPGMSNHDVAYRLYYAGEEAKYSVMRRKAIDNAIKTRKKQEEAERMEREKSVAGSTSASWSGAIPVSSTALRPPRRIGLALSRSSDERIGGPPKHEPVIDLAIDRTFDHTIDLVIDSIIDPIVDLVVDPVVPAHISASTFRVNRGETRRRADDKPRAQSTRNRSPGDGEILLE